MGNGLGSMKYFPSEDQLNRLGVGFGFFFLVQVLMWGAFAMALLVRGC